VGVHDDPRTHPLLRGIRALLDRYPGERMMVGEVNLDDAAAIARYYGAGDQLHLAFNFVPLHQPWEATAWRWAIGEVERHYRGGAVWPTWVLSNHDVPRHRTRYGGSEARARAAAVLLLTLRGTPVLYAGEELGLADADIPPERRVDPGGRDGCRAPIPWEPGAGHGWAGAAPWLPWPPEPAARNSRTLAGEPGSILHRYRALLAARRASSALHHGDLALLDSPDDVLAYRRAADDDCRTVLVNFSDEPRGAPLRGVWTVELASDGRGEGERYAGKLAASQAVLLR
jgi:alpha-glucosidase